MLSFILLSLKVSLKPYIFVNFSLRYNELQKKYEDTIKSHVIDLDKKDDTHDQNLRELEETYEQRLASEKGRCDELKDEMANIQDGFTISFEKRNAIYNSKVETIKSQFGAKEKRLKAQICRLEEESKESDKIFTEILDQQEEEYEMELLNLRAKSDERLHDESLCNQHMKGAVQNLNSKKNQLSRLNDELKSKHLFTEDTYRRELSRRKQIEVRINSKFNSRMIYKFTQTLLIPILD